MGFELEALWDDGAFGFKHWYDFSQITRVSNHARLRAAVSMFKPFFLGELRLFKLSDLPAAKDWLTDAKRANCVIR
jgi:hypothetical protein